MDNQNETIPNALPAGAVEIALPSGKKAVVFKGNNKKWLQCLFRNANDVASSFCEYSAEIVEIDGKKLVQEDYEDMEPKEYAPIFQYLSSVLF